MADQADLVARIDSLKAAIIANPALAVELGPQLTQALTAVEGVSSLGGANPAAYCHSHCGSHCNSHPQSLAGIAQVSNPASLAKKVGRMGR